MVTAAAHACPDIDVAQAGGRADMDRHRERNGAPVQPRLASDDVPTSDKSVAHPSVKLCHSSAGRTELSRMRGPVVVPAAALLAY